MFASFPLGSLTSDPYLSSNTVHDSWPNITDSNSTCPGGIPWIFNYFNECIETSIHLAAFVIGLISLALWFLPLIPQIYENYRRGNADESLSIYFIIFWIFGDTSNFTGCLLTRQLATQILIGGYYILQDIVLLTQFIYYWAKNRYYRQRLAEDFGRVAPPTVLNCMLFLSVSSFIFSGNLVKKKFDEYFVDSYTIQEEGARFSGRKLLQGHVFNSAEDEIGYALGSLSAVCYLCARVPQLIKNFRRRSTQGLALSMFAIMVCANLTYGISILMAGQGEEYLLRHLPWLIGSLGCCFCDFMVIGQIFYFWPRDVEDKQEEEEERTLLGHAFIDDDTEPLT